jgi:hypothetical protein
MKGAAVVAVGLVFAALVATYYAVVLQADPLQAAYDRIREGMTEGEVERLVGRAADSTASETQGTAAHPAVVGSRVWVSDGAVLWVHFADHAVAGKDIHQATAFERAMARLRTLLRL